MPNESEHEAELERVGAESRAYLAKRKATDEAIREHACTIYDALTIGHREPYDNLVKAYQDLSPEAVIAAGIAAANWIGEHR